MKEDQQQICILCGVPSYPALRERPDYEYSIATRLRYWRCTGCGLVFARPIPSELIPSFYKEYTTHERSSAVTYETFWKLMSFIAPTPRPTPGFRSGLRVPKDAAVLDFGCGGGGFLKDLRVQGFTSLCGYDFDPLAAAASLTGVTFLGSADELRRHRFDVITLNHVIEHVEDPVATLRLLRGLLNEGGLIYVRTPNSASFLARLFGTRWRGWETPRHLNIMNRSSLMRVIERASARADFVRTSNDMLAGMFVGSMNNVASGPVKKIGIAVGYAPVAWASWLLSKLSATSGEELVAAIRA